MIIQEGFTDMQMPVKVAASNWPNNSRQVSLDYSPGDFFYFQPIDVGQFTNNVVTSDPEEEKDNKGNITKLELKCTDIDLSMSNIDSSFCYPYDPNFVKNWSTVTNDSKQNPPYNLTDKHKQCFRSQTCANSLLSKSLAVIESTKDEQKSRYEDLEDIFFHDCINIFNMSAAILAFVVIIIYKSLYNNVNVSNVLWSNI